MELSKTDLFKITIDENIISQNFVTIEQQFKLMKDQIDNLQLDNKDLYQKLDVIIQNPGC